MVSSPGIRELGCEMVEQTGLPFDTSNLHLNSNTHIDTSVFEKKETVEGKKSILRNSRA